MASLRAPGHPVQQPAKANHSVSTLQLQAIFGIDRKAAHAAVQASELASPGNTTNAAYYAGKGIEPEFLTDAAIDAWIASTRRHNDLDDAERSVHDSGAIDRKGVGLPACP